MKMQPQQPVEAAKVRINMHVEYWLIKKAKSKQNSYMAG